MLKSNSQLVQAATQLLQNNDPTAAIALLAKSKWDNPAHPQLIHLLNIGLLNSGQQDQAGLLIKTLRQTSGDSAAILDNLATKYLLDNQFNLALYFSCKALDLDPALASAWATKGTAEQELNLPDQSIVSLQKAITLSPNNANYLNNFGNIFRDKGQISKAEEHYNKALKIDSKNAYVISNLATCLLHRQQYQDAIVGFQKALAIHPNLAEAHYNLALCYLFLGEWEKGFTEYQWRIEYRTGHHYLIDHSRPGKHHPRPYELEFGCWYGKRITLVADQGMGDELFFLRFVPALVEKGCTVNYKCSPKLLPLLENHPALNAVSCTFEALPRADHIFSVGDAAFLANLTAVDRLPAAFRVTVSAAFASDITRYIDKTAHPSVGVTWRAGTDNSKHSLSKSVSLADLLLCFSSFKGNIVILQRNPHPSEIQQLHESCPDANIIDASMLNDDLQKMTYLLSKLAMYIGVSNTNFHLLAGIQAETQGHVLVPIPGEFRWSSQCSSSPWFTRFTTYFESTDSNWKKPLAAIGKAINNL